MTCRELAPPDGFIAFLELMRDLHSLRRSGLRPAQSGTTMPSADLCLLPLYVAIQGASGLLMIALTPCSRRAGRQISPDKNVNFPCTTAAFTLSPEPVRFVVSCQLARRLSLTMRFLSVGPHFCHRASFRPILTDTPLPPARTSGSIPHMSGHPWLSDRGLSPHKFTPMPGVHDDMQPIAQTAS